LYQEDNFPITIQMVAWLPGNISPIHNHGTWGLVAVVSGQEKIGSGDLHRLQMHPIKLSWSVKNCWCREISSAFYLTQFTASSQSETNLL
jgi:hypothetical protein